jgi:hypothetical protein
MTQKKNIPLSILSEGDMSDVGNEKAYNERSPDQIHPPESPLQRGNLIGHFDDGFMVGRYKNSIDTKRWIPD